MMSNKKKLKPTPVNENLLDELYRQGYIRIPEEPEIGGIQLEIMREILEPE